MTENKRQRLKRLVELGFTPAGKTWHNDKHEKVRCACGWERAFYRTELFLRHREECDGKPVAEAASSAPVAHPTVEQEPVFRKSDYPGVGYREALAAHREVVVGWRRRGKHWLRIANELEALAFPSNKMRRRQFKAVRQIRELVSRGVADVPPVLAMRGEWVDTVLDREECVGELFPDMPYLVVFLTGIECMRD